MNKPVEKLYDAITDIDETFIEKAEKILPTTKKRSFIYRYKHVFIGLAACICLVYGVGFFFLWGPAAGGGSGSQGTSYMSYAGPIFPLSSTSDVNGIEVTRHTNWDFAPYKSNYTTEKVHADIPENTETYTYDRYKTESIVTDQYVLTNPTDTDITLSLTYPFAAKFSDSIDVMPKITVDGSVTSADFIAGKFSGSFTPALGSNASEEQLNLDNISSWEGYKALLSNDVYFSEAQKEFPSLDIPITVYEYANLTYNGDKEDINPTFAIHFKYNSAKTTLSGWGWNACGWQDTGTGYYGCSHVYTPGGNEIDKGATAYLIIIGEDIETPIIRGYKDGGCDEGDEIEGIAYDAKKYKTTMKDFISNICFAEFDSTSEYLYGTYDSEDASLLNLLTKEMALGYIAQLMYDDGILSGDGIERYGTGWLEDYVYDYPQMSRVMYLTFDVTIPAGDSITVDATMVKEASMDFVGKNKHRNGYDMVTTLASPFTFTKQTASLSNFEDIIILDQNFGFDLENGITDVELDIKEEHYWMDVYKKIKEE
ncbi:MAG: hypothetical protein J6I97_04665 [Agathobacter sp.]|nr:hypothetical protein [Agathobacter sp.]